MSLYLNNVFPILVIRVNFQFQDTPALGGAIGIGTIAKNSFLPAIVKSDSILCILEAFHDTYRKKLRLSQKGTEI